MPSIAVSDLRANLMKTLSRIRSGAKIRITSRGKDVAELIPVEGSRQHAADMLKEMGREAIIGDIIRPIDEAWDAEK